MKILIEYENDEHKATIPFERLVEILGLKDKDIATVEQAVRESIAVS